MPARFCPQCQHEVTSTARFCPNCASVLGGPGGPVPTNPPVNQAQFQPTTIQPVQPPPLDEAVARGRMALMLTMAIGLVILLAIIFVMANHPRTSVLTDENAPPPPAPAVIAAPSTPPVGAPPLVSAPAAAPIAAPPLTSAPSTEPGALPPDAAAYVKFLQGIEERRIALNNDTDSATAMYGVANQMKANGQDPDPEQATTDSNNGTAKIGSGFGDYSTKWQTLVHDFDATEPPASCQVLGQQYHKFLSEYADVISKLQVALLNHDIGSAMSLQSAQQTIDADGIQADTDLTNLCNLYNAPKPFSIQPEGASPSLITQ